MSAMAITDILHDLTDNDSLAIEIRRNTLRRVPVKQLNLHMTKSCAGFDV